MSFKHNVIFEFLTGVEDKTVTKGTKKLIERCGGSERPHRFTFDSGATPHCVLRSEIMAHQLLIQIRRIWEKIKPTACRIYLTGHSDWKHQKIGNWRAAEVAQLCKAVGVPAGIGLISALGCKLGRDVPHVALAAL